VLFRSITALTAQNTKGVQGVFPVPASFVLEQLESIFSDIPPGAVKIGMLHDSELIKAISSFLKGRDVKIVLDPVMVATSGDPLLEPDALDALQTLLFPLADLVTPNVHELGLIAGNPVKSDDDLRFVGEAQAEVRGTAFLVKGGDLEGSMSSIDYLCLPGEKAVAVEGERVDTRNTHGTGCTLSSSIASHLALGFSLERAVQRSKQYIISALEAGKDQDWGKGRGPVNHMWNIKEPVL
ncbi:MAG: bifunctional hydroxymethylpyrimidine kinase/phosphomethylpyrimidine kinase, partial [Spirochaetales bacterium]|nr:bifunctional hydroxymethylpyrimidine kinase/phosphomethylpyrimidine kinase [Spirochaetales bacterium]